MRFEDLFNDQDDETIEEIVKKYPVLSRKDKKRIFGLIKRKTVCSSEKKAFEVTVSGVEVYSKSTCKKFLKYAAVIVLPLAISSAFLISKNSSYSNSKRCTKLYNAEKTEIASELTDNFAEAAELFLCGSKNIIPDESIFFYDYSQRNKSWEQENIEYYRVNEDNFKNRIQLLEQMYSCVTDEYMSVLENMGGVVFNNSLLELVDLRKPETYPTFIEFNGGLYSTVRPESKPLEFTDEAVVIQEDTNNFTVSRNSGEDYIFQIVWDGSQWKINDIKAS